jgi:hypothetical protein
MCRLVQFLRSYCFSILQGFVILGLVVALAEAHADVTFWRGEAETRAGIYARLVDQHRVADDRVARCLQQALDLLEKPKN